MKRGKYSISIEALKGVLGIPPDLKVSGAEYNFKNNCIEVWGYSDKYQDISEGSIPETI